MGEPVYQRIAGVIGERILSGVYPPGGRLPSLRDLIEEFNTSRMSVIKAMDLLELKGLVNRLQGRGTFALAYSPPSRTILGDPTSEVPLDGAGRTTRLVQCEPMQGPAPTSANDGSLPDRYQFLKRIMYTENSPYHVGQYYLNSHIYGMRTEQFWRNNSMAGALLELEELQPLEARQRIRFARADVDEANTLELEFAAPVIHVRRVFRKSDSNMLVCLALMTYRADMVEFDLTTEFTSKERLKNIQGQVNPAV